MYVAHTRYFILCYFKFDLSLFILGFVVCLINKNAILCKFLSCEQYYPVHQSINE